ncbi:hypothetical protein WJX84_004022 [Apatococcus fuscideae]|uniref:Uncharacterized protein n=1 Tax=Apatococcus fuscideae TaxID=2026836 RepID=A0AAW1SRF6_9CHLO
MMQTLKPAAATRSATDRPDGPAPTTASRGLDQHPAGGYRLQRRGNKSSAAADLQSHVRGPMEGCSRWAGRSKSQARLEDNSCKHSPVLHHLHTPVAIWRVASGESRSLQLASMLASISASCSPPTQQWHSAQHQHSI